ncbi:MAG: hypothetical protein WB540_03690, partial [Pseudolabrys sp.]
PDRHIRLAIADHGRASVPGEITKLEMVRMSANDGGFNRSTQHSISFYLLGFEPQGLARTASDAKVPGFSAAVKPRKNPRRFVAYSVFPLQDRKCCVDRLNRPSLADISGWAEHVRFAPESGHITLANWVPKQGIMRQDQGGLPVSVLIM